jgi:phosphoribosylanthranilate isomerase
MIVKICGIRRLEDALASAEEGAAAVGFIFVRTSPRYVDPDAAAEIIGKLPPFVCPVGVFVNELRQDVLTTIERTGIRCLQFHGEESPADTAGYPVPVIKAFHVSDEFDPAVMASYPLPAYLLDSSVSGMHGGTGKTFDWRKAQEASVFGRIILSGGITPENAAAACRMVRPYAIDVNSGVESSAGIKDRQRIRDLFENLRNV